MQAFWWTAAGLVMTLIGVPTLFFFGMPYTLRTDGADIMVTTQKNPGAQRRERVFGVLGWFGLALIVAGTVAQIVGAYKGIPPS